MTEAKTLASVYDKLCAPFPPNEVDFLCQSITQDATKALAVPYIDSRSVMKRLDEVVGPDNWAFVPAQVQENGSVVGYLTIYNVTKGDVGFRGGDDDAAIKGAASDALKRAAIHFGIGRYLYDLPKVWWPGTGTKQRFKFENTDGLRARVLGAPAGGHLAQTARDMGATVVPASYLSEAPPDEPIDFTNKAAEKRSAPTNSGEPRCPDHGKSKRNKRGYFCPTKVGDDWCQWTAEENY